MFIVFSGLPGAGKSTIARGLAKELGAVWLRIDSLEQGIKEAGVVGDDMKDAGYRAAYAVAEDNLRLGLTVIGDSVNPWMQTRNAWRAAGLRAGVRVIEIETICSDPNEHRRRIETRASEVPGLTLPTWQDVIDRDYHGWDRERIVIDTAGRSVTECINLIQTVL
jgi:predicted kinase